MNPANASTTSGAGREGVLPHCSDCGEDHVGHHDRTQMSRTGDGLCVQPCDLSIGGRSFAATKRGRRAAETYYHDCRRHHADVCIPSGVGVE